MRKTILILVSFVVVSCSQTDISNDLREQVVQIAINFAKDKVTDAKDTTNAEGIAVITDSLVRFVINPATVIVADIDTDPGKDILITVDSLHGPYLVPAYHLLIKKGAGKPVLNSALRSDIKIIEIKDGVVTADIPTHTPESPLYYCSDCRDTVKYRILNNQFVPVQ